MDIKFENILPPEMESFIDEVFTDYALEKTGDCRKSFAFTLTSNGQPIGVVKGYHYETDLYLEQLVVHRDCRGKGYGKLLMNKTLEYAKERKIKKYG